jgi:hypothetical protein
MCTVFVQAQMPAEHVVITEHIEQLTLSPLLCNGMLWREGYKNTKEIKGRKKM